MSLSGRVALVTGGGRGLGQHMALALAQAGAIVAVLGRSMASLDESVRIITADGGRAMAVTADVTDQAAVSAAVQAVEAELGAVDVLVNNAGISGTPSPMWEADPDEWWQVFEINVRGAFLCARAVLPGMVQRKRGHIINVSSGAGLGTIAHGTAYSSSKAALNRMTDCLAAELEAHGVAVFSIHPGTVLTDMAKNLVESAAGQQWLGWFKEFVDGGGDVPAELSARLVVRLASGEADALSGRFISVTDDLDAMLNRVDTIVEDDLYIMRLRR